MLDDLAPGHLIRSGVTPILVEHVHDHLGLFCRQKLVLVREIDDEEDRDDSKEDGESAEDDKDPTPSVDHTGSRDLDETVGEDLRETADEHAHQVE